MSIPKEKIIKILKSASEFEKNSSIAYAKGFIDLDEKIESVKEKIALLPKPNNSDVVEAIKGIDLKQDNSKIEELLQAIADKPEKEIIIPKSEKIIFPKFPEIPKFPSEIEVRQPKWYEAFNYKKIIDEIKNLADKTFKIKTDDTLKVNILDSKGKIIEEFGKGGSGAHPGGYFSGWIKNVIGTLINPATEEKQDALLAELQLKADLTETQPVSATDLDIRNLTNVDVVTAELSAVDNAVLDVIAAKDFATQTTLALIKAKTDNIPALGQALELAKFIKGQI